MEESSGAPKLAPGKALMVVLGIAVMIATYAGIATALGIVPVYAGFAFLFYFGAIMQANIREFPPTVVGSLGGILVGALVQMAPAYVAVPGPLLILPAILFALFLQMIGALRMLINNAFMFMVTIALIPAVQAEAAFAGMACAILAAAAFMGTLLLVQGMVVSRRAAVEGA